MYLYLLQDAPKENWKLLRSTILEPRTGCKLNFTGLSRHSFGSRHAIPVQAASGRKTAQGGPSRSSGLKFHNAQEASRDP